MEERSERLLCSTEILFQTVSEDKEFHDQALKEIKSDNRQAQKKIKDERELFFR